MNLFESEFEKNMLMLEESLEVEIEVEYTNEDMVEYDMIDEDMSLEEFLEIENRFK